MMPSLINSESLFAQLPGYIGWLSLDFHVLAININAAKLLGFSSPEEVIGLTDYDVKCEAIKLADDFRKQNIKAIHAKKEIQVLGMINYADGQLHSIAGSKKPVYNADNEIEGLIISWQDIKSEYFNKLCSKLIQHDQYFLPKKIAPINKTILDNFDIADITESESEVLYYFMRGLSAREIGVILNRSQRTIEFHIDNIKSKFGAQKKSEIIAFCIEYGLLNIIPKSLMLSQSINFTLEISG